MRLHSNTMKGNIRIYHHFSGTIYYIIMCYGEPIKEVHEFIYLEALLSTDRTFKNEKVYASELVNRSMLNTCNKTLVPNLNFAYHINLYEEILLPVALYCCEVWGLWCW